MTLAELCEPLFLRMCEFQRAVAKMPEQHFDRWRDEFEELLLDIHRTANKDAVLWHLYQPIEEAMYYYVDSMIAESGSSIAAEWHAKRLAYARDERAGDEVFFEIVDKVVADSSTHAIDRLQVLYSCLATGFAGAHKRDPDALRRVVSKVAKRLHHVHARIPADPLTPEAYRHTRSDPIEIPRARFAVPWFAAGVVGAFLVLGYAYLSYKARVGALDAMLTKIVETGSPAPRD